MKLKDKEYFENKSLNISTMKEVLKSPKYFWEAIEKPKEPSPAMKLGSMIHCAILEPLRFLDEYIADPGLDKRTRAYKEWSEKNSDKLTFDSLFLSGLLHEVDEAVKYCEPLKLIREEKTSNEEAYFCSYKSLDLKCKVDAYCESEEMLIDLKTTIEIDPIKFQKMIFDRGYHLQLAHYKRCLEENNKKVTSVRIVAISTQTPYDIVEFNIGDEVLERATKELYSLYEKVEYIKTFNIRDGYSKNPISIEYPSYYKDFIF